MRSALFIFVAIGTLAALLHAGGPRKVAAVQSRKPAAVHSVSVVGFKACGEYAGILVTSSDGSTAWFDRPDFAGLKEAVADIPEAKMFVVDYCPHVST